MDTSTLTLEAKAVVADRGADQAAALYHLQMSAEEWAGIPDNPRQRDTERRLQRAKHLLVKSPEHAVVHMAVSPRGEKWKLDGHTRAMLWVEQPELAPAMLLVVVYPVDDAADAADLYTHFDSPVAVETAADRVWGAFKECGFTPTSPLLRRATVGTAVQAAEAAQRGLRLRALGMSTYAVISEWMPELRALDAISPDPRRFNGPLLTATLLTLRKYPEKAIEFWSRYSEDKGTKLDKEMDGVEALTRFVMDGRSGKVDFLDAAGKAISAFENYRRDRSCQSLKSTDPARYLSGPKRAAGGAA